MNSDSHLGTSYHRFVEKVGRGLGYNRSLTGNGIQTHMDGRRLPSVESKLTHGNLPSTEGKIPSTAGDNLPSTKGNLPSVTCKLPSVN